MKKWTQKEIDATLKAKQSLDARERLSYDQIEAAKKAHENEMRQIRKERKALERGCRHLTADGKWGGPSSFAGDKCDICGYFNCGY